MPASETTSHANALSFLTGGGRTGALIRAYDWAAGPLGAPQDWPQPLKTLVEVMLAADQPMFVAWGPKHILIYNDAYAPMLAMRHPVALGCPFLEVWSEVEGELGPLFEQVFAGIPVHMDDLELTLLRAGTPEQAHFAFGYTPVRDEAGVIAGLFCVCTETTRQVLAERERIAQTDRLRESEERNRRIAEGVRDYAIFTTDRNGLIADWTRGAEAIFGWPADEIRGQNVAVLFTPEDRADGAPDRVRETARVNGCANDERWHIRRDGTRIFVNGSVRPLHGADGEITGFIKIGRDETERRAVDARLRASEEFNRRVLASSADGITVLDLDGCIEFMSEGGMRVMEVDEFPMIEGKCWPDFWQGERDAAVAAVDAAKRGGTGRFQGHAPTLKGSLRWWDVIVTQIAGADGTPEKLLSISRDVTATKAAEEALRDLNATLEARVAMRTSERNMLANILESTDVMVMACDLDLNILAINTASADEFERLYGMRPAAGANLLGLLADQPEHQEEVGAGWARGREADELMMVQAFGPPGGYRRYYEIKFRALLDDDGQRVGTYQFVTDVSDRVREQAELAEAQEALRQSQKLEAMGQLTGGVSHDFNNLLTPIIGSLDLLQRRGLGGEREQRLIDGALQSAERAKTLVQRLLAFARRQPLQAAAVDVAALVEGMADLVSSTAGPRVRVVIDAAADLPAARADANQLEMALLNLAVNARDAMPDGGTLTIAAQALDVAALNPAGVAPGRYVQLSVADSGVGMDEATLARAIEPFFSTKGVGKGTGLGLSMVHGLAAQLGGGLSISSTVGAGTRIDLWLPATVEPASQAGTPRSAAGTTAAGTVLLIDDEDLVRTSTADMLADLGYRVVEAGSAEAGLRMLEDGLAADLLVSDHLMPGMTGTELALVLRERGIRVPVLIVSGYAESKGIALDLPRLTKPFRQVDLAASIAALARSA